MAEQQEAATGTPAKVPKRDVILKRLAEDPDCAELLIYEEENTHTTPWLKIDEFIDMVRAGIVQNTPDKTQQRDRLIALEKFRREAKQRRQAAIEAAAAVAQAATGAVSGGTDIAQASSSCVIL